MEPVMEPVILKIEIIPMFEQVKCRKKTVMLIITF